MASACRGVRGATTVEADLAQGLEEAVGELLAEVLGANQASTRDVAAVIFTVAEDLLGINPAAAARACGFEDVPLLVVREHGGDSRVSRCLRVLLLLNTQLRQDQVSHVYLGRARVLRPDLTPVGEERR
ncbi:MAG TPA: chorismate mutase [Candidatus Dormibacteraeota bacterium]